MISRSSYSFFIQCYSFNTFNTTTIQIIWADCVACYKQLYTSTQAWWCPCRMNIWRISALKWEKMATLLGIMWNKSRMLHILYLGIWSGVKLCGVSHSQDIMACYLNQPSIFQGYACGTVGDSTARSTHSYLLGQSYRKLRTDQK